MAKIKVLVCCHKATYVPNDDVYLPIQVGKANSKIDLGFQGDDEGKNISEKNFSYCELTAVYWAWKNLKDIDYIGLCHYRRFFDFSFRPFIQKEAKNITESQLRANLDCLKIDKNIEDYDDRIVNNDVKELYEDYMRLKNKNAIQVPLEKKILAVMSETGYKKQDVFNLTIRDFYGLFAITVDKIDYQIKENARIQGAKFKTPPEHWIIKGKKDKYAEIFTGAKEFTDKISGMSIQR